MYIWKTKIKKKQEKRKGNKTFIKLGIPCVGQSTLCDMLLLVVSFF